MASFVVDPVSAGLNVNLQERLAPRSLLERPSRCHYSRDSLLTAFLEANHVGILESKSYCWCACRL